MLEYIKNFMVPLNLNDTWRKLLWYSNISCTNTESINYWQKLETFGSETTVNFKSVFEFSVNFEYIFKFSVDFEFL